MFLKECKYIEKSDQVYLDNSDDSNDSNKE